MDRETLRKLEMLNQLSLTDAQKEMMHSDTEHILLVGKEGEYELVPYFAVDGTPEGLYAYTFTRKDKNYAVYWFQGEDKEIALPLADFVCEEALGGDKTPVKTENGKSILPASHRRYLSTEKDMDALKDAFRKAQIL